MYKDIEDIMDIFFAKFKELIPTYVAAMTVEKKDSILAKWPIVEEAYNLDSLEDFPSYKIFFLLFVASDPVVKPLSPSYDAIETYTLCFTTTIADDMSKTNDYYRAKRRYNRIIKQIVIKYLTPKYENLSVTYRDSKAELIKSPNGSEYEASAVYFDVSLTVT